jgi:hypothetical protein|nr:MAG TPA: hypothetical protein [Caudoviricetes sp.]
MKIFPENNQSFLDIALIYTGDAGMAYEIAVENNMDIDTPLSAGMELTWTGEVVDRRIVDNYRVYNRKPATFRILTS